MFILLNIEIVAQDLQIPVVMVLNPREIKAWILCRCLAGEAE
jgi:hypothetical protein